MDPMADKPQVIAERKSNFLVAVGLALSLVAGIGIAVLGHRLGGGELKRWIAFCVGAAVIGDVVLLSSRCCLSRAFKPKKYEFRIAIPVVGDSVEVERIQRHGGRSTLVAIDIGCSTLSQNQEGWLEDTERLNEELGGEVQPNYTPSISSPIVEGVEDKIKDKTFLGINERIKHLNGYRLLLLKHLSVMVRSPEEWNKPEVKKCFGDLHRVSCELAETVMRFVELKYPDSMPDAVKKRGEFLEDLGNGYMGALSGVYTIYRLAATRSYFDASKIESTAKELGLEAKDYWNDDRCWTIPEECDLEEGEIEYQWRELFNRACDRITPVAIACYDRNGTPALRLRNVMRKHTAPGEWAEPPKHLSELPSVNG